MTQEPPFITDPNFPRPISCTCPKCGNFWCRDYGCHIGIDPICQLCGFAKPHAIKNPNYVHYIPLPDCNEFGTPVAKMPNCPDCDEDELGMISPGLAFCYRCAAHVADVRLLQEGAIP